MEFVPYLVGALFLGLVGLQAGMVLRMRLLEGRPLPALDPELAERLQGSRSILFYFYNPRCDKCALMTPTVERLTQEHDNVVFIDVTEMMPLARRFHILATPVTVVARDGRIARVLIGVQTEQVLRSHLETRG